MPAAVELTAQIRYKGWRATQFTPANLKPAITSLRADLIILKCPQPKAETIAIHSQGSVQFSWITTNNSVWLYYARL